MRSAVKFRPRFRSQVFRTSQRFPSKSKLRGLVSCRHRSWDPPSRAFPSRESRTSLETACSLAVIHRCAGMHRPSSFASGFTDVHAFTRLPGSPGDYELPFRAPKLASRSFWTRDGGITPFRQLHLLRSLAPLANPFATTLGCPWVVGRCSPGFSPLRSFLLPRLRLSTHPIEDRARSRARGSMGPTAPRCRVRPS